jgi:hypothetical protein
MYTFVVSKQSVLVCWLSMLATKSSSAKAWPPIRCTPAPWRRTSCLDSSSLQAVVPTEALETTIRAKGLALAGVVSGCMGFINTFTGPIGLANIGYRYVWVFVGWDTFEGLMWYLFGVESQGKTLEELNWIYDQPNPVKASLKRSEVVVADDGTIVARADEL